MHSYNTERYIDHLEDIVSSYNSQTNRTINMSPNDAYLKVKLFKGDEKSGKQYSKVLKSKKK